jgi:hypothetical protein
MKPNCYECKYRSNISGDAHSCCKHPNNGNMDSDIAILLSLLSSAHRGTPADMESGLNIVGNPTGIQGGWFNWPFNYDPTWLENCDGFTQKGKI